MKPDMRAIATDVVEWMNVYRYQPHVHECDKDGVISKITTALENAYQAGRTSGLEDAMLVVTGVREGVVNPWFECLSAIKALIAAEKGEA